MTTPTEALKLALSETFPHWSTDATAEVERRLSDAGYEVRPKAEPLPEFPFGKTLRIDPFLGYVNTHAEVLVRIADATGCEVREDFNGDDLLAMPGDVPAEVVRHWEAVRTLRQEKAREGSK
jgi:hypothetical protein